MNDKLSYVLYGYIEFFPTEIGFVTPVFESSGKFYIESANHDDLEELIEISDEYCALIVRYDKLGSVEKKFNEGDFCWYGFKFRERILFGVSYALANTLKELCVFEDDWDYAKEPVAEFIKEFDVNEGTFGLSSLPVFKPKIQLLTPRQHNVLEYLLRGLSLPEIASRLFKSVEFIKIEKEEIVYKLRSKITLGKSDGTKASKDLDGVRVGESTKGVKTGDDPKGIRGADDGVKGKRDETTAKGSKGAIGGQGAGGADGAEKSENPKRKGGGFFK